MRFFAYSHKNLLSTHKSTLEFTKDNHLTLNGDCIIGVSCDFDSDMMINLARKGKKMTIKMYCDGLEEIIKVVGCEDFSNKNEAVIRRSSFRDERTFAISSSKAAKDLSREFINRFRNTGKMEVEIIEDA
ncbi:DUF371 domain-containing protein [Candidatus Woesearchaeota archaeon]|nr:DUF371 domain-containing protein [Candidatus Woesearchaeota archaeon]